jgi:hypothetical protein
VVGGSLNTTGGFVMRATRVGSETTLARIVAMAHLLAGADAQAVPDRHLRDEHLLVDPFHPETQCLLRREVEQRWTRQ